MKILPFTLEHIDQAISLLRQNKPVILPTDTIYGLHLPFKPGNLELLNVIKNRPANQPCNAIYADVSQITALGTTAELDMVAALSHISGLSTIISSAGDPRGQSVRLITGSNSVLCDLLLNTGPLYSTSANVSGETYVSDPKLITKTFEMTVELLLKRHNVSRETILNVLPSTIIDLRHSPFVIIREGMVTREIIQKALHV